MPKKSVTTPEDQLHIVAAILAIGLGEPEAAAGKPNSIYSITAQRYRQFVRMLSRSAENDGDDGELEGDDE
ncbi:MAG TPA: hypothetical protein VHU18_03375 [Rhizomicrobium sp.]|jgi:hypothetical protein|nr:hypothetical protein [Rhizomicrobium sp.]